ncbi:GGDEF domain-containing protein [Caminibacter sp.]
MEKINLILSKWGLLLTALVTCIFISVKICCIPTTKYELILLFTLFFSSIVSYILLVLNEKLLKIIQIIIYAEIIIFVFVISYLLKNKLILIWVYLTLLSSFIIIGKRVGIILSFFIILNLIFYSVFIKINLIDFLTLFVSLIIFTVFSFISVSNIFKYHNEMVYMAKRDFLTGLYNRRAFFEIIKEKNDKNRKAILMLDIDHFKKINDTYGHDLGDKVLKEFSKRVSTLLRKEDIFARIGGEEFLIFFENFDEDKLFEKAEEIRKKIKATPVKNISFTVSIGGYVFDNEDIELAIKKADLALYKAKDNRDKVVILN